MRFLNRDDTSFVTTCGYAVGLALFLSIWPPTREWLGLHRAVDGILLAVAALWLFMLLVWAHQAVLEQLLRWVPALLTVPAWLPPLIFLFLLMAVVTPVMLLASIILVPAGFVAMLAGFAYSWWRRKHGVTLRCPVGACLSGQSPFRDLELLYECPGCHSRYGLLIPSHLGFFYHHCTCGSRLPALGFLRRRIGKEGKSLEQTLDKWCPKGMHRWGIGTEALPSHFVALAGGILTGKTCYMTAVVQELIDGSGLPDMSASIESKDDERSHKERWERLRNGDLLPRTNTGVPEAIAVNLRGKSPGKAINRARLYLYDAAGEEYSGGRWERASSDQFVFFQDLTGVILLVDPLPLRNPGELSQSPAASGTGVSPQALGSRPSATPLAKVVESLHYNVSRFLRLRLAGRSHVAIAVVITKADDPCISQRVGSAAITQAVKNGASTGHAAWETEHEVCRQALIDWGAGKQVSAIESEFNVVRYFSCSPLGRVPDNSSRPFEPDRVVPPLQWVIETTRT